MDAGFTSRVRPDGKLEITNWPKPHVSNTTFLADEAAGWLIGQTGSAQDITDAIDEDVASAMPRIAQEEAVHMHKKSAELCFNDWAGFYTEPVLVVGETPKRHRIEAIKDMRLAGRCRSLKAGETALVPKTAVRFPKV